VRQVAGEPEELQLEREHERVCLRSAGPGLELVEELEEASKGAEGSLVRLLLGEEAQHRFRGDQADVEAKGLLARRSVRLQQLDPGDRLQLTAPLVEEQLDMAERLESRAEARLRLPHALGHSSHAAAFEGVEV
jgi:hypothetical protein